MIRDINKKFDWIDALKAFALIGIIINHFVEEFDSESWFTNPSSDWPDFSTRMHQLLPTGHSFGFNIIHYLGWLGDSCPGVFIILSGFALMWSSYKSGLANFNMVEFYKKRLLRLFPLYISIHLITLFIAVLIPGNQIEPASKDTLLSLIGLRTSDYLFYYINPSWWFIWLIIQLYVVFPLLLKFLQKYGIKFFLIVTVSITILSRLLGILNLQHLNSMYIWMNGSFFGTRLAEFAIGMGGAYFFYHKQESIISRFSTKNIAGIAAITYVLGVLASFTLWGSLISNLLVSLGLSGLFYGLWIGIEKMKFKMVNIAILWIGINSYAIFLFHQFPLQQTAHFSSGTNRILLALLSLAVSLPIAWLIDNWTCKTLKYFYKIPNKYLYYFSLFLSIAFYFTILYIEPKLGQHVKYNLYSIFQLVLILFLIMSFAKITAKPVGLSLIFTTIILCSLYFFLIPKNLGNICPLLFAGVFPICLGVFYFDLKKWRASFLIIFTILILASLIEFYLNQSKPLENYNTWGEYPAIQTHPTRIYALIPNKITHLRYNNYDYIVRTNQYGLASPFIDTARPTPNTFRILLIGDAFTMPEGMEYEYSYPALLEKKMKEAYPNRNIQIINGGVTGYGPVEEYPEMKELACLFKPDLIIYEFFINEFEEVSYTPQIRLQSLKRVRGQRKIIANSQILIHLLTAKELLWEKITKKPGIWRYDKTLLYFYEKNSPLYQSSNLDKLSHYLKLMKDITNKYSSKFFICYVPSAVCVSNTSDINYYPWNINLQDNSEFDLQKPLKYLKEITDKLDIDVLDLTPSLKKYPLQPVYFPDSWHWNKEGHKAVTEEILDHIIQKKYFTSCEDSIFKY
jgi:peptidoglycan/LPS O-acetylase OafA/YrhL